MFPPFVALPQDVQQYTLDTVAYDYQIGCALLQQQLNGDSSPFGY